MKMYSKCNNVYREYMFGKWIEQTCKNEVWHGKCFRCKEGL